MKVLLSWLKEFVDVDASGEEIGARMSLRGFALEGIERLPDGDDVLDFDVTSNRPDCMSVTGLAREVATAYGRSLSRKPELMPAHLAELVADDITKGWQFLKPDGRGVASTSDIRITIENGDRCRTYAGAVADVTVGPSPDWMQARLKACGIRPISNIVDITNYVLLELGQPMHAFDLAALRGAEIRVRDAKPGERLKTLDGQDRELTPQMLVIADAEKPIAIAGVMGGADSEVGNQTTTIVLESAYFDPLSVRRTSRNLGMKTEASMRFERGADRGMPAIALMRALTLIEQTGAGTRRDAAVASVEAPADRDPLFRKIRLRRERITTVLGTRVPDDEVFRILGSLGFPNETVAEGWDVVVPPRRIDVHREVDLIEEVARHYGFDRIPSHFPALTTPPAPIDPRIVRARQLRAVMTGAGFSEAVTFGFISQFTAAPFVTNGDDWVSITNPLSETFAVLRPSILPGLLAAVAHNRKRQQANVRLFEIGSRFTRDLGERRAFACVWTGTANALHWSGSTRDVDFFDMKGLVERVGDSLQVPVMTVADLDSVQWLMPGRNAIATVHRGSIGFFGQLTPALAAEYELPAKDPVYVAEIDLDAVERVRDMLQSPRLQVEAPPRFPSVTRDISILVADTLAAQTVRQTIASAAPDTLASVSEFDRYQGKGVPEGQISLSLRLTFQSAERTLTDAEVQNAMDTVLAALKEQHSAVQR